MLKSFFRNLTKRIITVGPIVLVLLFFVVKFFPFNRMVKIVYVSRDEIVHLEKQRIKENREENLFFGKIKEAVQLIEKTSAKQGSNRTIVIYSDTPVFTKGVESISLKVHREVIDELKNATK